MASNDRLTTAVFQIRDPRTGTKFDLVEEEYHGYQNRNWFIVRTETHEFGKKTTIRLPMDEFVKEPIS